ncbi:hypothetical protein HELRODRAFT_71342 [Helobdella robusta]|uniref:tRNA N(3)-methylcytidine methyltransferase n=1 Tax=Helobdella robusta TaxID=6412 RepID=T1G0J9_HELRO|nr:hypothetical protein HELRODRAFT_71342 [Helobdella robusta]ESO11509.1 hypothetical protein HELRODRAFT_71342 [Helobdella robusta]
MAEIIDPRILTDQEIELLEKQDKRLVPEFRQKKLEEEVCKSWDLFYKRNETKFYKDRHWTAREFEELLPESLENKHLLEVGCGVGNFIYPLVQGTSTTYFHACDFSSRAVEFVKKNELYDSIRINVFHCDLTRDSLSTSIPCASVDIVSLIFVLSAIHPNKMMTIVENLKSVLKSGGKVLFRDYGNKDHAMLRFAPGQKLSDRLYVRQDNTRAYYFILEELQKIFESSGFQTDRLSYIYRETVNKKENMWAQRIFLQGVFIKT